MPYQQNHAFSSSQCIHYDLSSLEGYLFLTIRRNFRQTERFGDAASDVAVRTEDDLSRERDTDA